jgi:hypothetical protein
VFRWIGRLWHRFTARWRRGRRHHDFTGVVLVGSGADPAPAIQERKLVLIGSAQEPKWLRFGCPCRCGSVIAVNLMKSHTPHWTVELHPDGTLTLHPSVDATACGSHFWVRRNRIQWV